MRTLLLCIVAFPVFSAPAQSSIGIQNDMRGIVASGANVRNTTVSTFSNPLVKGTQYLYTSWTPGSVTSDDNSTFSKGYTFNFDKVNHELYAKYGGESGISVLIEKGKISSFVIDNKNFVNGKFLNGVKAIDKFYQVLLRDSIKYTIYKLTTTKFQKANPNDIYAVKMGDFSSAFIDTDTYFLSTNNGELKKFNLTQSGVSKVLKDQDEKIEQYSKRFPTREMDEAFMVDLIEFLNEK